MQAPSTRLAHGELPSRRRERDVERYRDLQGRSRSREALESRRHATTPLYKSSDDATLGVAGPVFHPVDPFTISKVGKDINGGKLKGGDVIEWTITVTNTGLTQTTHVVVTDTVPNTTTYVKRSIRGKGADDSKQPKLRWDIGTMAVGEKQVVKFRSRVKKGLPAGTRIRNQAVGRL